MHDAGQALPSAARGRLEAGFGRDFGDVRIHDDARAHDAARSLGARAYAHGNHVVFGEGQYRPATPAGQGLLAHELAHVVQQGGVQLKADGPLPANTDARLEAEADHAAAAVAAGRPAPALTRVSRAAVFRNDSKAPAPPAAAATGPAQRLPAGMVALKDDPVGVGTTELVVNLASFELPLEKGKGAWVQEAYNAAGTGQRLIFTPLIEGGSVAAYKEGTEDYQSIWLGKYGFTSMAGVAKAFVESTKDEVKAAYARKEVKSVVDGLKSGLKQANCDIDHIVEKQIGGTSIPSNLQLLDKTKNRASGKQTYDKLKALVGEIRDPGMRGPKVRRLQLRLQAATVPAGTDDGSFVVESLLRSNAVTGKADVKAKAAGKPVALSAGGMTEVAQLKDAGMTPLDSMVKRLVPGMRLLSYTRGAAGAKSKQDTVVAELDSRAAQKTKAGSNTTLSFHAELDTKDPAAAAPAAEAASAGAPDAEVAGERRKLTLDAKAKKQLGFYYPYLSPGVLTSISFDEQGTLTAEGTITPTVPLFDKLAIRYKAPRDADETLELVAPIAAAKLKPNNNFFRFTSGELALQLSPSFVPKGKLTFTVGPEAKPVVLGELTAKVEGGAFVATGTLKPGGKIPGISEAAGEVSFNSDTGWDGKLTAKGTPLKGATIDAVLGFKSTPAGLTTYGSGGLTTQIKDANLVLRVDWRNGVVGYTGEVTIQKPLPLVNQVTLKGHYANDLLRLTGQADITWKKLDARMTVVYTRKDGEEGKFAGSAEVKVKTDKADGFINLNFDETGQFWGKGSISYQVTKDIRPRLTVELTKDHRIKVLGEVALNDIALTKKWPSPEGGKLPIIKGLGVKFNVPTPVPGITAYGEIKGSLGLGYGVGPVMLKGVKFSGELYPLEDDPKVKAKLSGKFAVPGYGELYGTFGAFIGVEVLLGAAGAKGGIEISPSLRIAGEGGIDISADYDSAGFSFEAEAYAKGSLTASVKVDLVAEVYAAWGLFSHTWTYNVAAISKQLGPELKIILGKVAYSKDGQIIWPSLSQIRTEPENIDPLEVVKELMGRGEAKKRSEADSANAKP